MMIKSFQRNSSVGVWGAEMVELFEQVCVFERAQRATWMFLKMNCMKIEKEKTKRNFLTLSDQYYFTDR